MRIKNKIIKAISVLMVLAVVLNSGLLLSAMQETETMMSEESESEESGALKGKISWETDEEGLEGIEIRLYDRASYVYDDPDTEEKEDEENQVLYKAISETDGSYLIKEIQAGEYRMEFAAGESDIDFSLYEWVDESKDAEYEIEAAPEDGAEAFIDKLLIEAETEIHVVLKERVETETVITEEETEESETAAEETETPVSESALEETDTAVSETEIAAEESEAEDEDQADAMNDGVMTIEELKHVDPDIAMATMNVQGGGIFSRMKRMVSGTDWSFDVYYVNENDAHHVDKTNDFNLKYQMEFHNNVELAENTVEIRIPRTLFTYRNGEKIYPTDIAVPRGRPDSFTKVASSPFNYYIDGDDLVFFNYETIKSGTNAAFQVLYKNLKAMEITDGTTWSLQTEVKVNINEAEEQAALTPLTGAVNTKVTLSSVTKEPYYFQDKNYTPGLYTKNQVKQYIQKSLPQEFEEHFDEYAYAVWEITVIGSATQPWNMYLKDVPKVGSTNGILVGYKTVPSSRYNGKITESYPEMITDGTYSDYTQLKAFSKESEIGYKIWAVAAYPKAQVDEGTRLENNIEVILEPYDKKDADQQKAASAEWNYMKYTWEHTDGIIRVDKWVGGNGKFQSDYNYASWLDAYRAASALGEDVDGLEYRTRGLLYGYLLTHELSGDKMGQLIPDKSYELTTLDDLVYLYPDSDKTKAVRMGPEDYYFSKINITQDDVGYDIWEDAMDRPYDTGMPVISVWYKDSTDWEELVLSESDWVKETSGETSIRWKYDFTADQIAKGPWRVKVVHHSTNYRTECNIRVEMAIRHDSKAMKQMLKDNPNMKEAKIENIAGVYGEEIKGDTVLDRFVTGVTYVDLPDSVTGLTEDLYGTTILRDAARARVLSTTKEAKAFKNASATNDVNNARVNVNYQLTAYEGYQIYAKKGIEYLREHGVQEPGRKAVVFYDLLPYGVQFDPSVPVTAGRITNEKFQSSSKSWDKTQVEVTVDENTDIIPNYNGTGRTMVRFHVTYGGADPTIYIKESLMEHGLWMSGWGVSFGAYYSWKDIQVVGEAANISAFMPEADDNTPIIGTSEEVSCDDGVVIPTHLAEECADFGSDIDGDGVTNVRNVLYASKLVDEEVVIAAESGIKKLVRADADGFSAYQESAIVETSAGYSYDLTVTNAVSGVLEDIVIYDRLENAGADRGEQEPEMNFEDEWWYGTFAGVNTKGLEELGIAPVIYYNASREAKITAEDGSSTPAQILTAANGWYSAAQWKAAGKSLAGVAAVAIDISKTKENTKFQLESMQAVSLQIHMTAPASVNTGEHYAYNNASFYSRDADTNTKETVIGDSVKVELKESGILEVEKQFQGTVPSGVRQWQFCFTLYRVGELKKPYGNKSYDLYKKNSEGTWIKQSGLYATDANGDFYLHGDEKAVFAAVGLESIEVEEEESVYWDCETIQSSQDNTQTIVFKNSYRPPIYVTKQLAGVPVNKSAEAKQEKFEFQILEKGKPLANAVYWYVSEIRTDGGLPDKLGEGMTDAEGKFTLIGGQIIAIISRMVGTEYEIVELAGAGEGTNWICKEPAKSGTLPAEGAEVTITNYYRWKDLYLTKEITHQEAADCNEVFEFQLCDAEENPVAGKTYVIIKDGIETEETGVVDDQGLFSSACAGKVIRIEGLEAQKTYIIKETKSGTLYQAVNGGLVEVTMPLYSSKENAVITNDYLLRSLSVNKMVLYDQTDKTETEELKNHPFYMTAFVNDVVLKNYPYLIMEAGQEVGEGVTDKTTGIFPVMHGQTIIFKDAGRKGDTFKVTETQDPSYPQIYPLKADKSPDDYQGNLGNEGGSASFVNGEGTGRLILSKEYSGADEAGNAYIDQLKSDQEKRETASVELILEVTDQDGTYTWPKSDTEVLVIDQLGVDEDQTVTWKAGESFVVAPWKNVILSGLDSDAKYYLKESGQDQNRIYEYESGQWLEIKQTNAPVKGTVAENPVAIVRNEAVGIPFGEGSKIRKVMTTASSTVPEGAKLVWRLEQYNGSLWKPASGVSYVVFDSKGAVSDQRMTTGSDGQVILTKTANGYPWVQFLDAVVKINVTDNMQPGDYRLVELLEESAPEWGQLAGYGDGSDYSLAKESTATGFVNANYNMLVQIEKQMEEQSDDFFTMILKKVTSTSEQPVVSKDQITDSEYGVNVPYIIYDRETGKEVGSGVTTKDGEFRIKAGQYVQIELPGNTLWTVEEKIRQPYQLKELSGSPDTELTKLDDNLMLIYQEEPKFEEIYINREMVMSNGGVTTLDGTQVDLLAENIVIPEKIIWQGKKYIVTGIADGTYSESDVYSEDYSEMLEGLGEAITDTFKSIQLPGTLKYIGRRAFYGCSELSGSLFLADSIATIGEYAFAECGKLSGTLTIPKSLKVIERRAFYWCKGFESLVMPEDGVLERMSHNSFAGCTNIKGTVKIPDTVYDLGPDYGDTASYSNDSARTFKGCRNIEYVEMSKNVKVIPYGAFADCSSLKNVINSEAEIIGGCAFEGCSSLESLDVLNGVSAIYPYAFSDCDSLINEVIPDSVSSVSSHAFSKCDNLETIYLSKNLSEVSYRMFAECPKLSCIDIPGSVKIIDTYAFYRCYALKTILLPTKTESGDGGIEIKANAFGECGVEELTIPGSVRAIGNNAFSRCENLKSVIIEEDVETMGNYIFYLCKSLENASLLGLKRVANNMFSYCERLNNVTLSDSLDSIEGSAFYATGLVSIVIPGSVTSIGSYSFGQCKALTSIDIMGGKTSATLTGSPWGAPGGAAIVNWNP